MLHKSHESLVSHFWKMLDVLKGIKLKFDSTTCLSGASLMLYSESCNSLNRLQASFSAASHRHLYQNGKMKRWKDPKQVSDITRFMSPSEGKNTECFARHSGSYVLSICAARDLISYHWGGKISHQWKC